MLWTYLLVIALSMGFSIVLAGVAFGVFFLCRSLSKLVASMESLGGQLKPLLDPNLSQHVSTMTRASSLVAENMPSLLLGLASLTEAVGVFNSVVTAKPAPGANGAMVPMSVGMDSPYIYTEHQAAVNELATMATKRGLSVDRQQVEQAVAADAGSTEESVRMSILATD